MTDPIVQSWRTGNSALGGRLVDVESLPNVVLARSGILTGGSAATWADADATISRAWAAYQALEAVLDEVERTGDPHRATALMAATPVATAQGRPPTPARPWPPPSSTSTRPWPSSAASARCGTASPPGSAPPGPRPPPAATPTPSGPRWRWPS